MKNFNRILSVFILMAISFFAFAIEPDSTNSINPANAVVSLSSDTIELHLNQSPATTQTNENTNELIKLIVGLLVSLYELIIRIVPTADNYSILHKLFEILTWLSNLLNRKQRRKTQKSSVHAKHINYTEDC